MKDKYPLYFENLDALRFFCFLSVFFYHGFYSEFSYIADDPFYRSLKTFFSNGMLGVNFFFVLSGFLITYLLIKEKTLTNKVDIFKFYLRRILRIWPLYFFCVLFGFFIFPLIKHLYGIASIEPAHMWIYFAFVNNFELINNILPDCSTLGILWSLAIEEQFYFIWPLLITIIPVKYYKYLFILIVSISLGFRIYYDNQLMHDFHSLSCMNDMAIGGLGAFLMIRNSSFSSYISHLPKYFTALLYVLLFIIFFYRSDIISIDYVRPFERLITSIVFLFILLEQSFSHNSFFKVGKIMYITNIGKISYGLYCLHMIAILITLKITSALGINKHMWEVIILETVLALLITILISKISYKYYESPFLKLKDKFKSIS